MSAKLIPRLSATRSIVSRFSEDVLIGTPVGYRAFMKVQPGRNNTNIIPKAERM